MFAIETAKLSSKGQMVIPDSFRKRYGWVPGVTLMLIGTDDSLVIQSLPQPSENALTKTIAESKRISETVEERVKAARTRLAAIRKLGLSIPIGIEDDDVRMNALMEKHS
jgi:bifunctional DNA-binding transcriptional regulator/antitoxin component of YhaV-PrlF toxin-antitoxin module